MPSEETLFTFPQNPEDAIVRLTILVKPCEGDSLRLSASLSPGSRIWDHEQVERVFREARNIPIEGSYVLETSQSGTTVVSAPEGVDAAGRSALILVTHSRLEDIRQILVDALRALPSAEIIDEAAREVVPQINRSSLEHSMLFDSTPVVDAREVVVEGVDCVHCGLGFQGMLHTIREVFSGRCPEGMKLAIEDRDGQPVVLIGYLGHGNEFASVLNKELARRLKAAIEAVAVDVITQMLIRLEMARRQASAAIILLRAYRIDPEVISLRVDALEAEARKPIENEENEQFPAFA